jgi:tetratricopeptide (TPR) repeat protein
MGARVPGDEVDPAERLTKTGEGLESSGDMAMALLQYESALRVSPTYSLAAFRAGSLLAGLGRLEEAATYLRMATTLAPDHAPTWQLASKVSLRRGLDDEALREALIALDLDPNRVGAALVALRALVLMEDWHRIIAFCAERRRLCGCAEARLTHTLALCRTGDHARACGIWETTSDRERRRFRELATAVQDCVGRTRPG